MYPPYTIAAPVGAVRPTRVSGPLIEPVSIEELKGQTRVSHDQENLELYRYIQAARAYFEDRTDRTISQTTWKLTLDYWPGDRCIILPRATPLIAVTGFVLKDSVGNPVPWVSTDWIADTDSEPGRVVLGYGQSWPSFTPFPVSPITITYTAGIADTSPATEAEAIIKHAILMLAAGFYENRESEVLTSKSAMDALAWRYGVEACIQSMRVTYVC